MLNIHRLFLTLLLAGSLATISCADDPLDLPIGPVTLPDTLLILMPGETGVLEASDDAGPLEPGQVTWTSDALSAVSVEDGVVTAVGPGWSWVRASSGIRKDSVRVVVRFESVPEDGGRLRIIGVPGGTRDLAGALRIIDDISGGGTGSSRFVVGPAVEPAAGESGMHVIASLQGEVEPGVYHRGGYEIEDRNAPQFAGSGFLFRDMVDGDLANRTDYGTVDSFVVVVEQADYPERPGWIEGRTRGIMAFGVEGIRYESVDGTGTAVLVTDTIAQGVFEWDLPIERGIAGGGSGRFEGGPVAGETAGSNPTAALSDNGGVLITLSSGSDTRVHRAWVPVPAAGELAVDSVGPELAADDTTTSAVWVRAAFYQSATATEPYLEAYSSGGILRVFEYVAPTGDEYGWIRGSLVVPMDHWSGGSPTGDETEYNATWAAPIPPLNPPPADETEGTAGG